MNRHASVAWLIVVAAVCGGVAALGHPRPAIAAAATALAVGTAGARRLAVLVCVVSCLGLVAASVRSHPSSHPGRTTR